MLHWLLSQEFPKVWICPARHGKLVGIPKTGMHGAVQVHTGEPFFLINSRT
jgi:hypothetical protein